MTETRIAAELPEETFDQILGHLDSCRSPGGVFGVAVDGMPVYRKGFGLASIESPAVLAPATRLRIGSVSKQFTCFAYMRLCEDGNAELDDPIGRYLPELHPVARSVTMRQLMGHTSGLRDVYSVFDRFNEPYAQMGGVAQSVNSADLLSLYRGIDDVDAAPGTAWIYNNGGYLLLSTAIERIADKSLEEVMSERVFRPLDMCDSLLLRSDSKYLANRGSQHVVDPSGGYERLFWGVDSHFGGGAVVSTADDLLRWLGNMGAPTVGTERTWEAMTSPQTLANGTSTDYGLGLQIARYRGVGTVSHAGNALGGNAHVLRVPQAGLDIVILINRQDVWSVTLTRKILDVCLRKSLSVTQRQSRSCVEGIFRSPKSGRVIQLFRGTFALYCQAEQQIVSIDGMDLPFEFNGESRLAFDGGFDDSKQQVLLQGDPAAPDSIRYRDYGNEEELVRVPEASGTKVHEGIGVFQSNSIDTTLTIFKTSEGLRLKAKGRFGSVLYRLESLSEGVWRARTVEASRVGYIGGVIALDERAETLQFSSYHTRSLIFRRCDS